MMICVPRRGRTPAGYGDSLRLRRTGTRSFMHYTEVKLWFKWIQLFESFCITHLPNLKGFLSESKMVTYFCTWSVMDGVWVSAASSQLRHNSKSWLSVNWSALIGSRSRQENLMWTLLRLTLDLSVDTAKNAQVPLRKSCRPPKKCHKKYSAQQPSTVFAFRWWFAWHANRSKSSSCVVVVVLSGLDADGHQQATVIHFDCGGLGHDLLCTIPKSNCDLNEFNFSNLFALHICQILRDSCLKARWLRTFAPGQSWMGYR